MPRIKSLLANAHQFLLEPVVEQWPQQLLLHIDELVSGAPLGARSRVPETPFKRLSVVLNVLGEGAESIAFWDGDRMLLSIHRRPNGGSLCKSVKGVYIPWRTRVYGPRRLLLDAALSQCVILCEIRHRQRGEVVLVAHHHEETGTWAAAVWPAGKGLVLAKKGSGTRPVFVEPVSPRH